MCMTDTPALLAQKRNGMAVFSVLANTMMMMMMHPLGGAFGDSIAFVRMRRRWVSISMST